MKAIKINKNHSVPKSQWKKVECLPTRLCGPGWVDKVDEAGNRFRITFPTWTSPQKVNLLN